MIKPSTQLCNLSVNTGMSQFSSKFSKVKAIFKEGPDANTFKYKLIPLGLLIAKNIEKATRG